VLAALATTLPIKDDTENDEKIYDEYTRSNQSHQNLLR
jgi:hypothetical protein